MKRIICAVACCAAVVMFAGCGGGDDAEPTGSGQVLGNVQSFQNVVMAGRLLAAVQGVTVIIDGPVMRSTVTDVNGNFSFLALPGGHYTMSFVYNGEEVSYRGASGQLLTISVADNQRVVVTDVTVSGGLASIGDIAVVTLNASGDPINDPTPGVVLTITPSSVSLPNTGNSVLLSVDGGTPDYTWSIGYPARGAFGSSNGPVTATAVSVVYVRTATGDNIVSVTDANDNTTDITIQQSSDLGVSPMSITILADTTQMFVGSGGTAPYTWSESDPSLGTVDASGLYTTTGPTITGTNYITVWDAVGDSATSTLIQLIP